MAYGLMVSLHLLQAVTRPDTLIARVIPERGVLDWTSGVLQVVVLLLGIASLVTLVILLLTVRRGVSRIHGLMEQFATETRPLMQRATEVVTDAREVVAMLRTDAERVSDTVNAIGDQLMSVADTTAKRVDEVNAVLDVLQHELEDTAIATAAAVRGVRSGATEFGNGLRRPRRRHDETDDR